MIKKSKTTSITLPWEVKRTTLGRLLSHSRWRTVMVIALASGLMALVYEHAAERRAQRETRRLITEVRQAFLRFRSDMNRCPQSIEELLHPPHAETSYLQSAPIDGWGSPLQIDCPGTSDPDEVDIISINELEDFERQ